MKKELRSGLRTWIEINTKAIAHNYRVFRSLIPKKTKFMAVVKSNAYGHDLITFAQQMEKLGVDYFGVDSIIEGIALRENGIKKPILVLGYTLPEMFTAAIKNNIEVAVSSFETLKYIQKNNLGKLKIHIKVDTGMGRHGFLPTDAERVLRELKKLKNVAIIGLFTHFSSAGDPKKSAYTEKQINTFENWRKLFVNNNYDVISHASATSATMIFPSTHFDMVRVGVGLYGIYPSDEIRKVFEKKNSLQQVLSWKTIIAEIKELPSGSHVGYNGTAIVKKKTKVAIIPIGYWHGYPRALSNIGNVLISGMKCNVLGRVCMDIVIVDVSRVKNIGVGDEVILIGVSGREKMSAENIAKTLDGSPYEIVTRTNPLIRRLYL